MEQNSNGQITPPYPASVPGVCPVCHQPVLPQYYFCPNCGAKLNSAPLSTAPATEAWIYLFSIILPMFVFIFIGQWPGIKYLKSDDKKAKRIGQVACFLLILSTIVTLWFAIVWIQEAIQSSINNIMPA